MNFNDYIYPFTTEMISGYFDKLDLKEKTVLTVGSSIDQGLNALLLGAKNVTVYDINPNVEAFFEQKRKLILSKTRNELYDAVLESNFSYTKKDIFSKKAVMLMNTYLNSNQQYENLREKLENCDISFVIGDIFKMEESGIEEKFDRIILSNALQYLPIYADEPFILKKFNTWNEHLEDEGILQLLYLYSYQPNFVDKKNLKILNVLHSKPLEIEKFYDSYFNVSDAIVTYKKTKRR